MFNCYKKFYILNMQEKIQTIYKEILKKMKTLNKRILLLLALLAVVLSCGFFFTKNVSAATKTGFVTINGKTYYVKEDGSKAKAGCSWVNINIILIKKPAYSRKAGWLTEKAGSVTLRAKPALC